MPRTFTATASEMMDGGGGYCRECGAEAFGVEPDARRYTCESCGRPAVYGLEELLIMGELEVVED